MRGPGGPGVRMKRNELSQRIFRREKGQNFPPLLECSNKNFFSSFFPIVLVNLNKKRFKLLVA